MANHRSGTKGVPREVRETAILDAAGEEFERRGYAGAVVGSIAARVNVSKTLVLSYFGSKEGVYIACVRRAGRSLTDAIGGAMTASGTVESGERSETPVSVASETRVLAAIFQCLARRPSDWPVLYDRTVPAGPARDAAREQRRALRQQAAEGVASALAGLGVTDPQDLSAITLVWENVVSALVAWWRQNPGESAADMTARSQRIFAAIHRLSS
ncbi:hypothetical TetR transcriptional regulator [Mycolicibacter terrae]|uniref:Hypothetical TetR transcriptional regulator n=1 Tax=Mycolicibacter terrae TaxID=1788 RepID=A0AAD1MGB0_9MYCO|nr:TetR/AcrR family transcriptional regulator [Mycolicibacter terrae]ORW90326.1 TetR family transcriptional regulator [Mycolicibacter terrae]BBX23427.1 hypothetical TetR transcriptional regulator [Mycolicibacter terrae]SNV64031.1 tetR family transcriptional regulator [Mycolicibacter terrae]